MTKPLHPHAASETFQEHMAEQLRRAPWIVVSVLVHGIALLVLMALPAPPVEEPRKVVQLTPTPDDEPLPDILKPQDTPVEKEDVVDELVIQDSVLPETDQVAEQLDSFEANPTLESAHNNNDWNTAIGLAGGAAGAYGKRGSGGRGVRPGGRQVATTIDAALSWLKDHQDDDGRWDADAFMKHDTEGDVCSGPGNSVHDVGVTGLALLAFLGDGSTMRAGPYRDQIIRGVNWLRKEQDQQTGLFGSAASHDFIYDHAIATYAVIEACGLSEYRSLRDTVTRALGYLESHRNPYMVWRYAPKGGDNDTSVTGWCVMAYQSAKHFGFPVNDQALELCKTWLDRVTDPATGRAGYMELAQPSSRRPGDHGIRFPSEKGEAMTAVAVFCRYFMHQDPKETPIMEAGIRTLMTKPPVWNEDDGSIDHYAWYYATYAVFQWGKGPWKTWSKSLVPAVVKTQRQDGNFTGSWDPVGVWGDDGGRVYSTAILALTLEAYYRYTALVH